MSLIEIETPYHISTAKLSHGLGSAADRRAFIEAAKVWHQVNELCKDVLYPAKHPKVEVRLRALGLYPDEVWADQIFGRQLEAARKEFSEKLGAMNREKWERAVTPKVRELMAKLSEKVDDMAAALETREKSEAEAVGIPYHKSVTLLSIKGTADSLRERQDSFSAWTGDPVEIIFANFFEGAALPLE